MNLLLLGHMVHGKNTFAEMLLEYGVTSLSSSEVAAKLFIYDILQKKYNYASYEEFFKDRINHRKEWFDLIVDYNKNDLTRLAKDVLNQGNCYNGMRSNRELQACKKAGIFDLIIGIYNPRLPLETTESFDIDIFQESDIIIPNAGTLEDLKAKTKHVGKLITYVA